MHLETRLTYEAFAYSEPDITEKLTEEEKLEHIGVEQLRHALAVFFLLKHINIRFDQTDEEMVNINLQNLGSLGGLIGERLFQSFDDAIRMVNTATTFADDQSVTIPNTGREGVEK